jgi:YD repeat-containing protein
MASTTDWNGNLTTYVNDVHGQPVTVIEDANTPQSRKTTVTYHASYHLPLTIVTPGLTTTFTYDGSGELLTRTLTDTTATTVPYVTTGTTRTWTFEWSNFLNASITGPRAELSSFAYDSSGALTKVTNPLNQTVQITEHMPGGLPLTIVDPNGVATTLTYDSRLRLLTNALSTTTGILTTHFGYDPTGNLTTITLPDGSALTSIYDSAYRLTGVSDLFHDNIVYTLDALGDRTQINVSNAGSTVQRTRTTSFDALGRTLQDVAGAGQATTFTYDSNSNILTETNPLSRVTQRAYDGLSRLIRVINAAGGVSKATYDLYSRPVAMVDPNSGSTTYVNAAGATANYTYDATVRMPTTTYPTDPSENVTYTYDESGHGFGIGRLTSVADAAGTLSRTYDERGNILSERRVNGMTTLVTSTAYDNASRVSSITYPSGWLAIYTRDAMGRITAINAQTPGGNTPQSVVSGVAHEPFGPVSALTYGNGVAEQRSYDLDYRLVSLIDTGGGTIHNLTYGYDAANDVLSINDAVNAANSQNLGYDVLNRLTSAVGGYGNLAYTYDAVGNRLTQVSGTNYTNFTYSPHGNQLTSIKTISSTQTVGTNAAGNTNTFSPAFGQVTGLAYNQANRLATTSGVNGQLTQ